VLSDCHDRMQRVRPRPKGAPLGRCKSLHSGILLDGHRAAPGPPAQTRKVRDDAGIPTHRSAWRRMPG
jgi:hypothetical protein